MNLHTLLAIKVVLFVYSTQLEELDIHYNLDEISRVLWGDMS